METETEIAATRGQAQEGARESAPAQEIFITVSDALEYLFCPMFIFFMHFSNPFGQNRTLENYLFHLADLASSRRNLRRRKVAI
jgi:hypothetical protein